MQQRQYAWRRIRKLQKESDFASSSAARPAARRSISKRITPTLFTSSEPTSSSKIDTARRQRLFILLKDVLDCRPTFDHPYAIDRTIQTFNAAEEPSCAGSPQSNREYISPKKIYAKPFEQITSLRKQRSPCVWKTSCRHAASTERILSSPSSSCPTARGVGLSSSTFQKVLTVPTEPWAFTALDAASALNDLLTPFGALSIGRSDFNTASWSITSITSSVLAAAKAFKNLRLLSPSNPFLAQRRLQLHFDGMSWTRGHGCTRFIVRSPDVLREPNSPLYSRDVMFYMGGDKLKDLSANFK
eukprot:6200259-Pleurochrysis_carterae.AAC.6